MSVAAPGVPAGRAGPGDFRRLYRAFLGARVVLALALAGVQLSPWLGSIDATPSQGGTLGLCLAYLGLCLGQLLLPRFQQGASRQALSALSKPWWWASTGIDLAFFTALLVLGGQSAPPVAALYVLPVMMSAVLANRRAGLAAASLATLGLLGSSLWVNLVVADWAPSITQAGLAGIGYFAIAGLTSELSTRLAREELAARDSLALARQQAALNQLVIDEIQEGVLVIDRRLQVQAANPAARALLGELGPVAASSFGLAGERAWLSLALAAEEAWARRGEVAAPRDVVLGFVRAPARTLRLRLRWMQGDPSDASDDLLLMLIEDRAKLLARARQEKLAAMGRMSAGIAHEIRNPLAAISQANALLGEDLAHDPGGLRLTDLVASNVKRLQRIVDEVMLLAAPADQQIPQMDAAAGVREVLDDWQRTQGATALQRELPPAAPGGLMVLFEPEHLRRVLVNLLDNGWRHAQTAAAPWVRLELQALDDQRLQCRVINPSPPLPAEIERHLFEPFHSTRSRSSGLGLYICRELCERYGARIDYQPLSIDGEAAVAFTIQLRRAPASS